MSHTRYLHLKAVFGPWWAAVNSIWALLSSADVLVAKFGSADARAAWDAAWIAPKWGWKVWIIGFVVITAACAFEASFRHIKKNEKESQERESELNKALQSEIEKHAFPDVLLMCHWKSISDPAPAANMWVVRNRIMMLSNRSIDEQTVYNVSIQDIALSGNVVRFPRIASLSTAGEAIIPLLYDSDGQRISTHDLETFLSHDSSCKVLADPNDAAIRNLPMLVQYEDKHGSRYEILYRLDYDTYDCEGQIVRAGGIRKVK